MARTDTLGNFLTDIADSIRTKTGETGTILASEFDTKIESIEGTGTAEDLSEELTTYDTELTAQESTVEDILIALENKSAVGGTTIIQNQQTFSIDDFIQAGATYTTDGYAMICSANRTTQFNGVYLKEVTDGTYGIVLNTYKKSDSSGQGFWYVYRYDENYFYVINCLELNFYSLSVNDEIAQIDAEGSFSQTISSDTELKIVVEGTTHYFYVDDALVGTITNANTIGAAHGHTSFDGSGFIVFTGLRKINETIVENDMSLNIYIQPDEPETKKGIWVKSDTLICDYLVPYQELGTNDSYDNALIFKQDRKNRLYYTDLCNCGAKTFSFTDIDYYSADTGYTQDIELYYGNDEQWILVKTPLPAEYTRVASLTSAGSAYFDSGVLPNANTGFDIDFKWNGSSYGAYTLFGARTTYYSNVFQYSAWQPSSNYFGTLTLGTDTSNDGRDIRYDAHITNIDRYQSFLYPSDRYVSHNGLSTEVKENPEINPAVSIFVYCLHQTNAAIEFTALTIYSLKFYENEVITRNFIPVSTMIDDTTIYGMYDLIDGVFYKSASSTEFTI